MNLAYNIGSKRVKREANLYLHSTPSSLWYNTNYEKTEVKDVCITEFDEKAFVNGIREEGCQNEQIRIVKNMLSQSKTGPEIADLLALPLEEVENLIKLATN